MCTDPNCEAESALRQVREDLTALADGWETEYGPDSEAWRVFGTQFVSIPFIVKTLRALARVGAADTTCPTCSLARGEVWGACPDQWHRAPEAWNRPGEAADTQPEGASWLVQEFARAKSRRASVPLHATPTAGGKVDTAPEATIAQTIAPVVNTYTHAHLNLCPCGMPEAHLPGGKWTR